MTYSNSRCVVTGGAGFIGSHVARELLGRHAEVVLVDDLSTGSVDNLPTEVGRWSLIEGDVRDPRVLASIPGEVHFVFHLAAAVGVMRIAEDPAESLSRNVVGTESVTRWAHSRGADLLFTSSSEVYGRGAFGFLESAPLSIGSVEDPRWSYGCGKATSEFFVKALYERSVAGAVITRLFNTVGPGQSERYGMVLPRFVRQALERLPMTVIRDGRQTRSFAHVDEVAAILVDLLAHPRAHGKIFNVGGSEEVSILDLAERIRTRCGSCSPILHVQPGEVYGRDLGDLPRRVPVLHRLQDTLGRVPGRALETILDDVIAWERRRPPAGEERLG